MDYLIAFVVGGIICAFVQILMEKTKLMPGRIMVILVIAGAILGAAGVYEPFAKWAKAGAAGISAALIFGYIASLFFDPKIKK